MEASSDHAMLDLSSDDYLPQLDLNDTCCICLHSMVNPAFVDPCYHVFCKDCLMRWLVEHPSQFARAQCPLCLSDISTVHHDLQSPDEYNQVTIVQPDCPDSDDDDDLPSLPTAPSPPPSDFLIEVNPDDEIGLSVAVSALFLDDDALSRLVFPSDEEMQTLADILIPH